MPSIPIWGQYVGFLESVLDGIAGLTHSGGLAIVLFTIIVKTILLPLTLKSIRSMKSMQDIQPKIKELQKKHGKNREELQKATMALYAQHQVNPVAGCLPMIIQIPIFFGVYQAIRNLSTGNDTSVHFAGSFLWLPDLGTADPWHVLPDRRGPVPVRPDADEPPGQRAGRDRSPAADHEHGHERHADLRGRLRLDVRVRCRPLLGDAEHLFRRPAVVRLRLGDAQELGAVAAGDAGAPPAGLRQAARCQ